MIKQRLILLILLQLAVLGLASCTTTDQATPTPFLGSGTSRPLTTSDQIVPVELADLAASPEFYEGVYLKVNGRYRRMPTHVCSDAPHPSPVEWSLAAGELIAHMNGLDAQLHSLIPDETTMVVIGIWRQWQGPVGCGKAAIVQRFWYLEVHEVISPNPLTHITLTPTHPTDGTQIASAGDGSPNDGSSPNETPNPDQEETAVSTPIGSDEPTPIPTITPSSGGGANPPTATHTVTAVSTEVDGDDEDNSAPTTTPTASSVSNNTPTPVSTSSGGGSGGSGTAVPPPPSLSTPTSIPEEVEIDGLGSEEVGNELIDSSEIHIWFLDLSINTVFTASVASQPGLNVALSLIDPTGNIIVDQQNISPAGSIETLASIPINLSGEYQLHIQTTENSMGEYAVSIYDDSDSTFPFLYQGVLEYGDSATATLMLDSDDFWHFYGNSGDNVTITLVPDDTIADMLLFLWGDTIIIKESDSENATEILTITLPDSGLYTIEVGDGFFEEQDYTISIIKDS